jgi:hypothetical protein
MVGSCEYGNEPLGSIKGKALLVSNGEFSSVELVNSKYKYPFNMQNMSHKLQLKTLLRPLPDLYN